MCRWRLFDDGVRTGLPRDRILFAHLCERWLGRALRPVLAHVVTVDPGHPAHAHAQPRLGAIRWAGFHRVCGAAATSGGEAVFMPVSNTS